MGDIKIQIVVTLAVMFLCLVAVDRLEFDSSPSSVTVHKTTIPGYPVSLASEENEEIEEPPAAEETEEPAVAEPVADDGQAVQEDSAIEIAVDSDGDGVVDQEDNCPQTKPGVGVDWSGCHQDNDSDSDGIQNQADKCPNTAVGTPVNWEGCPLDHGLTTEAVADSDGDGVPDQEDNCPQTKTGVGVDWSGCHQDNDSDSDGIQNQADQCPNTAIGTPVNWTGCPLDHKANSDSVMNTNHNRGFARANPNTAATWRQAANPAVSPTDPVMQWHIRNRANLSCKNCHFEP